MFLKYSSNRTFINMRIFEMINYVNWVYEALNIRLALVGIEIWNNRNEFVVSSSEENNLNSFSNWRRSILLTPKRNDNAQLLTGVDLSGATMGIAHFGTMCSSWGSVGIIQDHDKDVYLVAAVMAHEIGHNLGMNHDANSCTCTKGPCIMAASGGLEVPMQFSSCSLQDYQNYMMTRTPQCVINKPFDTYIVQDAVCGNYFEEKGEECDCGSPEVRFFLNE
ncbi:PREDICTED: zinc metalloproteinase-disintegrin-like ohanin [Thamnophis sirtalis]|uniref:Zinc metalloproteinase-disintegrin-like ohanin n=1 Tax=Thamnophis sirtalis TaxID=35019 RepID=A0A6I9YLE3_9SAUR|nr:PREDICTED: zinc metalloproteinase-disintegrin-like ohanin [Thamnophis sirtalis]